MEFEFDFIASEIIEALKPEFEKSVAEFEQSHANVTNESFNEYLDEYVKFIHDNAVKLSLGTSIGVLKIYHETLMKHLKQREL